MSLQINGTSIGQTTGREEGSQVSTVMVNGELSQYGEDIKRIVLRFFYAKKPIYAPSTVETISDNPDQDLLSKISVVTYSIIEAPPGI